MLTEPRQSLALRVRSRASLSDCVRSLSRLFWVASLVLWSTVVSAEPRDLKAEVETTFQTHYLATDFEAAEAALLKLIAECDASCARPDLARAWMYLGIVRGTGKQQADAAKQAFEQALVLDPNVSLDISVASSPTLVWFAEAGGHVEPTALAQARAQAKPEPPAARSELELRAEAAKAGLVCEPELTELQTLRALPIWCQARPEFSRVTLRYLGFNADGWVSERLKRVGQRFQGEIPCAVTEFAGPLKYFIAVTDRDGGLVATLGSLKEPLTVSVAEQVALGPPALPGEAPPERCAVREDCPPDFPGCDPERGPRGEADWGAACAKALDCKAGLICQEGRCRVSPECDIDSDCELGVCRSGRCQPGASATSPQRPRHTLVSLQFAADWGPVAGTDVCSTQNSEFECFTRDGQPYPGSLPGGIALEPGEPGDAYPGSSVGGMAWGSLRALVGYERQLFDEVWLGGRIGVAFNGAPRALGDPAFLPIHLEARASYWLLGSTRPRSRPFVSLSLGMAEVNLEKEVVVYDCSTEPSRSDFEDCLSAEGDYTTRPGHLPRLELNATRKLGRGFVGAQVGALVPVFEDIGVVPSLQALFMFPEMGFVLEPTLGLAVAF